MVQPGAVDIHVMGPYGLSGKEQKWFVLPDDAASRLFHDIGMHNVHMYCQDRIQHTGVAHRLYRSGKLLRAFDPVLPLAEQRSPIKSGMTTVMAGLTGHPFTSEK